MNIEKEVCKQHALHIKKETGKFPISKDWSLSNGFPISLKQLNKIFEGYNNFRNYCEKIYKSKGPKNNNNKGVFYPIYKR